MPQPPNHEPEPAPLDYLAVNVADWTSRADDQRDAGRRNWAKDPPTWGIFGVPETQARMLPSLTQAPM